jgi:aerobic carbon-monoxide dehydrogenase small subunit
MTDRMLDIALTVNGEEVRERIDARTTLVDFLRDTLALTGSHVGCEHGVCGACTVRVEGLSDLGELADLQRAFTERNAMQCGFCTPGMLLTAQELLKSNNAPSRETIRAHISGNYCRCTGYHAIVDAIEAVARARAGVG